MAMAFIMNWMRSLQLQSEANHLIEDAKEAASEIEAAAKLKVEKFKEQAELQWEQESEKLEEKIAQIEKKVNDKESLLIERCDDIEKEANSLQSQVDSFAHRVRTVEKKVQQKRDLVKELTAQYVSQLEKKTELNTPVVIEEIKNQELAERKIEMTKKSLQLEEDFAPRVESEAKKLLTLAINRFARPYCPERGIGYLNFENEEQKNMMLANNQEVLRAVEKLCGIDLSYDETNNAINVYGFDPVRRELGRATIERLMKERRINLGELDRLVARIKKDLFQKISNDGNRIANELKVQGLKNEVKNMMGALRYRYSFTQNQYFHCGEVGFLCGLLSLELGESLTDGRRAGLLHDIGKAMDHSIDGGHAVIGADFIKQHGESEPVVHAVRAHHFDETPDSNLAYLVIAADAVSGARPGARRSTVATYTQKIQDLQTIARSFEGVQDTHVLSAGREIRVYVDGGRIDDLKALDLSRQIAHKIEEEMQYPGQIRVTVVRETQAVEFAR